jgi:uncharacterized membrane protein (UPF0127 family)
MKFLPKLPRVRLKLAGRDMPVEVALASNWGARLRGLMFAKPLLLGQGLLIVPCNSIHMMGMRGALEAVFLDKDGRVLKISPPLRPWLGMSLCRGAHAVLEWAVGEAASLGVRRGDTVHWSRL